MTHEQTGEKTDATYASASAQPTVVTAFLRVAPENAQVRLDCEEAQIVEGKVRIERANIPDNAYNGSLGSMACTSLSP